MGTRSSPAKFDTRLRKKPLGLTVGTAVGVLLEEMVDNGSLPGLAGEAPRCICLCGGREGEV